MAVLLDSIIHQHVKLTLLQDRPSSVAFSIGVQIMETTGDFNEEPTWRNRCLLAQVETEVEVREIFGEAWLWIDQNGGYEAIEKASAERWYGVNPILKSFETFRKRNFHALQLSEENISDMKKLPHFGMF